MAEEVYTVRVHREPGEEPWRKSLSCMTVSLVGLIWAYCRQLIPIGRASTT